MWVFCICLKLEQKRTCHFSAIWGYYLDGRLCAIFVILSWYGGSNPWTLHVFYKTGPSEIASLQRSTPVGIYLISSYTPYPILNSPHNNALTIITWLKDHDMCRIRPPFIPPSPIHTTVKVVFTPTLIQFHQAKDLYWFGIGTQRSWSFGPFSWNWITLIRGSV